MTVSVPVHIRVPVELSLHCTSSLCSLGFCRTRLYDKGSSSVPHPDCVVNAAAAHLDCSLQFLQNFRLFIMGCHPSKKECPNADLKRGPFAYNELGSRLGRHPKISHWQRGSRSSKKSNSTIFREGRVCTSSDIQLHTLGARAHPQRP